MSLSTLIVQREIASIREVEEALARQVLYGGDLITNLLEVCKLDEAQLLPIVAESVGLPPASPGELPKAEADAMRLVAAEVAVERNLAPLTVDRYGLTVAVAEPLSADVEQELSFALALPISQKIAPLVRIKQALARDYGVPLDRRLQRLLQRMMTDGPRGSSFPPMRNADIRLGSLAAPRPPSMIPAAPVSKPPERVRPSVPPGGSGRTLVRHTELPAMKPLRRRRGAITVDIARAELEEASERDTIFDLLFEFARQYFDYTAVFIVHGENAEGRDAFGDGAARDKVARISVPLDLPSILAAAREKKAMLKCVPAPEGIDPILMSDLGRSGKTECIVLPIVVRNRVVAMLLGDVGETGIEAPALADVAGIATQSTAAFERLIVRRKLKGSNAPPGIVESMPPGALAAPGAGASGAPAARASMAPPTKLSNVSDRPSVEELAPPIRDLMTEPISRVSATVREPVVQAVLPAESLPSVTRGKTDQPPPPPNVLTVRRPSGRPIPREEPDSRSRMPAVTSPSNLGGAAREAILAAGGASGASGASGGSAPRTASSGSFEAVGGTPSSSARSRGRRGEAPKLDFGVVPAPASGFGTEAFSGEAFGADDVERKLLAEIQGRRFENEPTTTRDEHPPVVAQSNVPPPVSSDPEPPPSPKAESPPPMRAASTRPATDMSPVAIAWPSGGTSDREEEERDRDEEITQVSAQSAPVQSSPAPPVIDASPAPSAAVPSSPPPSSEMVSADDADVDVVDPPISSARHTSKPPTPWPSQMGAADPPEAPTFSARLPPIPESSTRMMPPSEQQISVALHRPPSSRSDHSRILPSVIVDVASEYVGLVERVMAGATPAGAGAGAEDAETELLRAGGYAMPAIMERFPGPVTIERHLLDDGPLPRVAECGPVLRLVASQRRTALPFVLSHVEDPVVENRFWATYLLTELVYPDTLDPILARVFDEEPRVRRAARAAARAFADVHPSMIVERLELVAMDAAVARGRRLLAIEALGETREPGAVPALIRLLSDPDGEIATAVRSALTAITRQDFGGSSAAQKWQAWWDANRERHRLEWLIDALMHEHAALRAAAGEELKTTTKEYFGYYDDLPKRERERAQSRYREWWNSVGRVRFNRASSSRS